MRVRRNYASTQPVSPGRPAQILTSRSFNQQANNPGHCYTGLAVFSPAVADAIPSTLCMYPQRKDQARWSGWIPGW